MFNFLLYYTSKIQHLTSNLKLNIKNCLWIYLYIQIFSNTKIHSFHIIFLQIYLDTHSYYFLDTNIFGYSFVSFLGYKYIQIFVRIENLYSSKPDLKVWLIYQLIRDGGRDAITSKNSLFTKYTMYTIHTENWKWRIVSTILKLQIYCENPSPG